MGTRGYVGFIADDKLTGMYNHFDSYPTYLGAQVVADIGLLNLADPVRREGVKDLVRYLKLVGQNDTPTEAERKVYADFHDGNVSNGQDWYSLLRGLQGQVAKTLAIGVMVDGWTFYKNSLFCEYGYVLDFDAGALILLRGFNHDPEKQWDRARLVGEELKEALNDRKRMGWKRPYYGCALVAAIPFEEVTYDLVLEKFAKFDEVNNDAA